MGKRKYVEIECAYCSKPRSIRSDSVKVNNFCGPRCSQKFRLRTPEDHPSWKGGRRKTSAGYMEVRIKDHHRVRGNGYVFEHIVALEKKIGRKLRHNEQCHHIDGDKTNNNPDNLQLVDIAEHAEITGRERRSRNIVQCLVCDEKVYRKPLEQKKNKNTFCSRRCLGLWTKTNNKGVFNIAK